MYENLQFRQQTFQLTSGNRKYDPLLAEMFGNVAMVNDNGSDFFTDSTHMLNGNDHPSPTDDETSTTTVDDDITSGTSSSSSVNKINSHQSSLRHPRRLINKKHHHRLLPLTIANSLIGYRQPKFDTFDRLLPTNGCSSSGPPSTSSSTSSSLSNLASSIDSASFLFDDDTDVATQSYLTSITNDDANDFFSLME